MHERNQIGPRLRPGEVMPEFAEGQVPTRVNGEIIGVPAYQAGDIFRGKSPYTERQVAEIESHKVLQHEQAIHVQAAKQIFFDARVGLETE